MAPIFLAVLLTMSGHASSAIAEPVEIRVPLDADGAYEVDKLLEQFNRALGTQYPIEPHRGQRKTLSPAERAAILLAGEFDLVEAQLTSDALILKFPAADDTLRRQQIRRRLSQWLDLPADYWTTAHGLKIPADFDPSRQTLLVVHGLEAIPSDLEPFDKACHAAGIQLLQFYYPNDGPLAKAGARLNKELAGFARRHPQSRIVIAGLSMGGLVARYALESPGMSVSGVTDLFLIGTPHAGSALADEHGVMELALQILPGGIGGFRDSLADGLGEAADDLKPGSPFLTNLNALPRAKNVRYHSGIGTQSFVSVEQRERILADMERIFTARNVPMALQQDLRQLVAADELKDGAGDGAVTIRSAQLSGCHNERLFALTHAQLMSLSGSRPEQSEVFQWILSEMDRHASQPEGSSDQ